MVSAPGVLDEWKALHQAAVAAKDGGYAEFVCRFPSSFYLERVRRIGFWGQRRVLDVGCGYGQWMAALCVDNQHVTGLDMHASRLALARDSLAAQGLDNWSLVRSDAQKLPFADASFDAVFCYGVLMFLDRQQTLREFHRVLRPGGKLYVCTNGRGWWLSLWMRNLLGNAAVRRSAWRGLMGHERDLPNATDRAQVGSLLGNESWENIATALEGHLPGEATAPPLPAYRGQFLRLDSVVEFCATRRRLPAEGGNHLAARHVETEVDTIVHTTMAATEYSYLDRLRQHPQPRPALDLVNNCHRARLRQAMVAAAMIDRTAVLKRVFAEITRECCDDQQRIEACIRFAQLRFFHHFAGQPMRAAGQLLVDPVAALLLGEGRCGTQARFLVDLFLAAGISARLVAGSCHTAAEARLGDRWILADANLFPPGVFPKNDAGQLLSIDEAAESPHLLDRVPSYWNYHHEYVDAFLAAYPETDAEIGGYLRAPLLPSAAYFGADALVAASMPAGKIVRYRKAHGPSRWGTDVDYGWQNLEAAEPLVGARPKFWRRPGQPRGLAIDGDRLTWQPGFAPPEASVQYRVVVSTRSRGWNYDRLPVGCALDVPGTSLRTDDPWLELSTIGPAHYASVVAEIKSGCDSTTFYLPSKEFSLSSS